LDGQFATLGGANGLIWVDLIPCWLGGHLDLSAMAQSFVHPPLFFPFL